MKAYYQKYFHVLSLKELFQKSHVLYHQMLILLSENIESLPKSSKNSFLLSSKSLLLLSKNESEFFLNSLLSSKNESFFLKSLLSSKNESFFLKSLLSSKKESFFFCSFSLLSQVLGSITLFILFSTVSV